MKYIKTLRSAAGTPVRIFKDETGAWFDLIGLNKAYSQYTTPKTLKRHIRDWNIKKTDSPTHRGNEILVVNINGINDMLENAQFTNTTNFHWIREALLFDRAVQQAELEAAYSASPDKPFAQNDPIHPEEEHIMPAPITSKQETPVSIFNFKDQDVRTITQDGEPWFVLGDVCKVLGIGNVTDQKKKLDLDSFDSIEVTDSIGRKRQTVVVNESGLYDVILDSRKPQAKAFRKWITSEVVPSIRKHGGYLTPEAVERTLADPDFIIQLAQNLKDEQIARKEAEAKVVEVESEKTQLIEKGKARSRQYQAVIEEQRPKAAAFDALMASGKSQLVGNVAKTLGLGQNELFKFLRDEKILQSGKRSRHDRNIPFQRYSKYFDVKVRFLGYNKFDEEIVSTTPYVKPEGMDFIRKRLLVAGRI